MRTQITSLILLAIMVLHTDADQNLIETTCKNTPNYKLCIALLRADPSSNAQDLPGLALIVVAAIKKKTQEALAIINNLKKRQPNLLRALKRCTSTYNAVLEGDITTAEQATRGMPKFAETAMADVGIEAQNCEEAFGVGKSPLTQVNNYVTGVADVARAIIRNLL